MPITPDDKNWTWVLERTCPECGFAGDTFDPTTAPAALRDNVVAWQALLQHPQARVRPNDHTWSALEYACHVRDVFRLFAKRLELMLGEDGPQFANWDQDATAIEDAYGDQDPSVVSIDLAAAGEALAEAFSNVRSDQRDRTGFRSDGASFTVNSFTVYMVHDPVHHVWDVDQGYAALSPTTTR